MRICLVTDTWEPEINGVVRTLRTTCKVLASFGHDVTIIHPGMFRFIRVPFYRDIRLSIVSPSALGADLSGADHVHIATEGPLGVSAAMALRRRRWNHSTSYHTDFPAYLRRYLLIPPSASFGLLRRFHSWSQAVMVAAPSVRRQLQARGFRRLRAWSRGVDVHLFRPLENRPTRSLPRAIYVGRVAREKNIEAFLRIDRPIEKIVVGDGPLLEQLKQSYPNVMFTGPLHGEALAHAYAQADVMVFPSRTDTFGLVMLESLACGTPVAAYPEDAPSDLLQGRPEIAALDTDLGRAVDHCLTRTDRRACREFAESHTWEHCTNQFLTNLVPLRSRVSCSSA